MTTAGFMSYIIFVVLALPVIYIRPHKLTRFFWISAVIVITLQLVILIWALATMGDGGFGATISGRQQSDASNWMIVYGIISTMGSVSAGILNQNDYARFATTPHSAIYGQLVSFPVYPTLSAIIGILVTAATQPRYGEAYWKLPDLLGAIIEQEGGSRARVAAFFAGAGLVISQIGCNVPANAFSGGVLFPDSSPFFSFNPNQIRLRVVCV